MLEGYIKLFRLVILILLPKEIIMKHSKKHSWVVLIVFIFIFGGLFFLSNQGSLNWVESADLSIKNNRILVHEFNGMILDSSKWIERVDKQVQKSRIRAVVFLINSPGGVVGPSQELYSFIKKIRDEYKKPVVVYSSGLLASGAYYMALGANHIMAAPGAMIGSIGVIMEFMNLESLYDFVKVKRFSITTGKYKDSGSGYRSMRDDEKQLFQNLINDVHQQFTQTVQTERNLSEEVTSEYCDGRVFTGKQAQELKFVDSIGSQSDAIMKAAELSGLGSDYQIHRLPKVRTLNWDILFTDEEEEASSKVNQVFMNNLKELLRTNYSGQPLYLYPGSL